MIDPSARKLAQYQALLHVSESIAANRDLQGLMRDLSSRLRTAVQFDYISVSLHDPIRDVLRIHAFESPLRATVGVGFEMPINDSPSDRKSTRLNSSH